MTRNEAVTEAGDVWSRWLLEKRFGGDAVAAKVGMQHLHDVRDRILDAAAIKQGDTLLDVGAGDGLIAFGALDRVGDQGHVIFCDISEPLLEHARSLAIEMGVVDRCSFVRASADDLSPLEDASVDVVTTRRQRSVSSGASSGRGAESRSGSRSTVSIAAMTQVAYGPGSVPAYLRSATSPSGSPPSSAPCSLTTTR